MKISDIMTEKNVVLGLKANSKRQLLQELSDKAAEITGINERTIFDIVLERENLGSTGFGGGTALPHGRIPELDKVYGLFAKLNAPVDFEAVDNKPVDLVFLLLSPEGSGRPNVSTTFSCTPGSGNPSDTPDLSCARAGGVTVTAPFSVMPQTEHRRMPSTRCAFQFFNCIYKVHLRLNGIYCICIYMF